MHMRSMQLARRVAVAGALMALVASPALAQGKGNGGKGNGGAVAVAGGSKAKRVPPGQAKKRVSKAQAVSVTRDVLVREGYTVARVERRGTSDVIWFYRGNNGNGKGRGPLQSIVVRPANEVVVFDAGPRALIAAINIRLGL